MNNNVINNRRINTNTPTYNIPDIPKQYDHHDIIKYIQSNRYNVFPTDRYLMNEVITGISDILEDIIDPIYEQRYEKECEKYKNTKSNKQRNAEDIDRTTFYAKTNYKIPWTSRSGCRKTSRDLVEYHIEHYNKVYELLNGIFDVNLINIILSYYTTSDIIYMYDKMTLKFVSPNAKYDYYGTFITESYYYLKSSKRYVEDRDPFVVFNELDCASQCCKEICYCNDRYIMEDDPDEYYMYSDVYSENIRNECKKHCLYFHRYILASIFKKLPSNHIDIIIKSLFEASNQDDFRNYKKGYNQYGSNLLVYSMIEYAKYSNIMKLIAFRYKLSKILNKHLQKYKDYFKDIYFNNRGIDKNILLIYHKYDQYPYELYDYEYSTREAYNALNIAMSIPFESKLKYYTKLCELYKTFNKSKLKYKSAKKKINKLVKLLNQFPSSHISQTYRDYNKLKNKYINNERNSCFLDHLHNLFLNLRRASIFIYDCSNETISSLELANMVIDNNPIKYKPYLRNLIKMKLNNLHQEPSSGYPSGDSV